MTDAEPRICPKCGEPMKDMGRYLPEYRCVNPKCRDWYATPKHCPICKSNVCKCKGKCPKCGGEKVGPLRSERGAEAYRILVETKDYVSGQKIVCSDDPHEETPWAYKHYCQDCGAEGQKGEGA